MKPDNIYDYSSSGLDGFLSRSIDDLSQVNLNSPGPVSTQIAYDRAQVTGLLGDTWRIGSISLDGKTSQVMIKDSVQIGETDTGEGLNLTDNQGRPVLDIVKDSKGRARMAVTDDTNTKRLYAGRFPNGAVAIKLSQPGFDVETATDNQLIWSSDFNLFKIVASGTGVAPAVTTTADGTNTYSGFNTNSYPHNLGYTPLIMAFVAVSGTQYSLMPYSEVTSANDPGGGIISEIFRITASSTNVEIFHYVVSHSSGIGAGTYSAANVKYYLLRETAT